MEPTDSTERLCRETNPHNEVCLISEIREEKSQYTEGIRTTTLLPFPRACSHWGGSQWQYGNVTEPNLPVTKESEGQEPNYSCKEKGLPEENGEKEAFRGQKGQKQRPNRGEEKNGGLRREGMSPRDTLRSPR